MSIFWRALPVSRDLVRSLRPFWEMANMAVSQPMHILAFDLLIDRPQ